MSTNIIKKASLNDISKTNDILFFPITLDVEQAKSYDAQFIKIVVLPSVFKTQNAFKDNNPYNLVNIKEESYTVSNDNIIDKNEVGTGKTPAFYKNIFSKNITTNLLQKYFTNTSIVLPDGVLFEDYTISIIRREISSNLYYKDTSNNVEELPHYFIVYLLDSYENVIETKIITQEEDFKIDDYVDASDDVIIESFLDTISGSLNIEWKDLQFDQNNIVDGPTIILNFPPQIINTIRTNRTNISLKYDYNGLEEIISFSVLFPRETIINQSNSVNPTQAYFSFKETIKNVFLEKLTFVSNENYIPNIITDLTDFTSNDFVLNLFKKINQNQDQQGADIEITIQISDLSFTKSIFVNKVNFNSFYQKYLEYNKLFFLKGIFKNFYSFKEVINDAGISVAAILINKFDFLITSAGLLDENSRFYFKIDNQKVSELYFDDNITFDNSLKPFNQSKDFYLTSIINNTNINTFYVNNISNNALIEFFVDDYLIDKKTIKSFQTNDALFDLNRFGNLNNYFSLDYLPRIKNTDIVEIIKNIYINTGCEIVDDAIEINFNPVNTINTELINKRLAIDLTDQAVNENVKYESLVNNTVMCIRMSTNQNNQEMFLGTSFMQLRDIPIKNNKKSISLNNIFNNLEIPVENFKADILFFPLNNNILNYIGKRSFVTDTFTLESVKEDLTKTLYEICPSKYFKIIDLIDNIAFNENIPKQKILNSIGEILLDSKLNNVFTIEKSSQELNQKTKSNKKKAILTKQNLFDNIENINDNKLKDIILDYSYEKNIQSIKVNSEFEIRDTFYLRKSEINNKSLYEINLTNNLEFSNIIKDKNFSSINVYSLYNISFIGNYENYKNVTKYEMNNFGCFLHPDHTDVISNFKINIEDNRILVSKKIKKSLRFNKNFYQMIYSIFDKNLGKIGSVINRIVFEITMKNGERIFCAKNILLDISQNTKNNNNISSNSNLNIDIDNEYNISINF